MLHKISLKLEFKFIKESISWEQEEFLSRIKLNYAVLNI